MHIINYSIKAGVDVITRNLSTEWGPYSIRVNGVAPGIIQGTEGLRRLSMLQFDEINTSDTQLIDTFASKIPLRHLGSKWDVGMACLFLVSRAAKYITGETLVVDGGQWLAHYWISRDEYEQLKNLRTLSSKL
jgi:peroxisomal 2,4-dienoyl-CoA reductase